MNQRMIGIGLLVIGVILLGWGLNVSESIGSSFSRAFTGSPTNKATGLMIGGLVLGAAGAYVLFFSKKSKR